MNNKEKGIILILIASLFGAITITLIKLGGNIPVYEKSFLRNICTIIISYISIKKSRGSFFGKKENRWILMLRAVCGTLSVWTSYYAISHMMIANSTILTKLSPIFTIIFASIFLKEKIKKIHIIAFVIAFSGVLFIVNPSSGSYTLIPSILSIASALLIAGVTTCIRMLGDKEEPKTVVFFYALCSMIFSVPLMIIHFKMPTSYDLIILLLAGVSSTVTQFAMTFAYKFAKAREISVYNYSSIIFVTILGYIIWGNVPSKFAFIGYIFIIIGALIIFFANNRKKVVI